MAFIEEVEAGETRTAPPSEERMLDAVEIEKAAATMTRPTARMHLEALAKKLRKESEALKRVEASHAKLNSSNGEAKPSSDKENASVPEKENTTPSSKPAESSPQTESAPKTAETVTKTTTPASPPPVSKLMKYIPIDKFSFDFGGYNSEFVTIYVDLPDVGSIPRDQITCSFKDASFDFIVRDLKGKSYRLFKEHLEKDIVPTRSKVVVKKQKVVLKLAKKKGEYGSFDHWSKLTDKKGREKSNNSNPQASIMGLMKDMYDSGDDQMKKMIGETMLKQRNGELASPGSSMMGGLENEGF